jgi:hypothetical protein
MVVRNWEPINAPPLPLLVRAPRANLSCHGRLGKTSCRARRTDFGVGMLIRIRGENLMSLLAWPAGRCR